MIVNMVRRLDNGNFVLCSLLLVLPFIARRYPPYHRHIGRMAAKHRAAKRRNHMI